MYACVPSLPKSSTASAGPFCPNPPPFIYRAVKKPANPQGLQIVWCHQHPNPTPSQTSSSLHNFTSCASPCVRPSTPPQVFFFSLFIFKISHTTHPTAANNYAPKKYKCIITTITTLLDTLQLTSSHSFDSHGGSWLVYVTFFKHNNMARVSPVNFMSLQ